MFHCGVASWPYVTSVRRAEIKQSSLSLYVFCISHLCTHTHTFSLFYTYTHTHTLYIVRITLFYYISRFYELVDHSRLQPVQLQGLVPLCMNGYRYIYVRIVTNNIQLKKLGAYVTFVFVIEIFVV